MKNIYRFADTDIEIETRYELLHERCRDYISSGKPEYSVSVKAENIENMKNLMLNYQKINGRNIELQSDPYIEYIAAYELIAERLLEKDILLFHGSVLSCDGNGYMFTAPSGTGKSTHSSLWRKAFGSRVMMINDDKPLLLFRDDGIYAYGTPWCGKHNLGSNASVKLKAISVLERAEKNSIERISLKEAVPVLYTQAYRSRSRSGMQKILSLIGKMNDSLELYRLSCNMDIDAAFVAEGVMNRK